MAKVRILGEAAVITSTLKLEDIKLVKKYRPEELVLKGGEDGKEELYVIGVTEGSGGINEYGASFGRESADEGKFAEITMAVVGCEGDKVEFVADEIGGALANLEKLEEKLPAVVTAIKEEAARIKQQITLV